MSPLAGKRVLATKTSSGDIPNFLAVKVAISKASENPRSMVQALAQPELTITAWALLLDKCLWHKTTGDALILLAVNIPAATQGTSE
jgi:hypothetical protein